DARCRLLPGVGLRRSSPQEYFQAVFGYFLPEPVQRSLHSLVRTEFVAKKEDFTIRLEPRDDGRVLVRIQQTAFLRNAGPAMQRIPLRLNIGNTNSEVSRI